MLDGQSKANFNISLTGNTVQAHTDQPEIKIPFPATILSFRNRNPEHDAKWLGRLRQQKKSDLVVEALHVIEPRLYSLEVNPITGTDMIWGDIGLSELVPLPVMGDGMMQLTRIVLAISSARDGVVLIDEIENGLHHSVLSEVWQVIEKAANQFNTQIVATTHSYECIAAAEQVFKSSDEDFFLLHRIERI